MEVIEDTAQLKSRLRAARRAQARISLVPTMGNLHNGHMALLEAARKTSDTVVATIFVNPLQFGPDEDFDRYPRTFEADREKLNAAGCDLVFVPAVETLYPGDMARQTRVTVPELSRLHCGASRPGHFDGVTTVVCKLFNLVAPDQAWFGEKDYQQLVIIRKMTRDLYLPISIESVPVQREDSGLAISSRNGYLSDDEKQRAASLYETLLEARGSLEAGNREFPTIEQSSKNKLREAGLEPDYFNICNARTLLPPEPGERALVILAAAHVGSTRLIDNVTVQFPE